MKMLTANKKRDFNLINYIPRSHTLFSLRIRALSPPCGRENMVYFVNVAVVNYLPEFQGEDGLILARLLVGDIQKHEYF